MGTLGMYPIFTSHFSIGKSILTLNHPDKQVDGGADSIFSIAVESGIKQLFLVEESMTGFFEAVRTSKELGIDLVFGYKFSCTNEVGDADSTHKLIIFAKNDAGCRDLNKIYSLINSQLKGKISNDALIAAWTPNLQLAVPFYDSFIFRNHLSISSCIPNLQKLHPIFFEEDNGLPFDGLLRSAIKKYVSENLPNSPIHKVKSIYYKNKKDCAALQTYKILSNRKFGKRADLSCPNLDHFGSDEFCWESYVENSINDR
jgi:hypothetical protein